MKFKLYDDDDNFIGEYVGEFIEDVKDAVKDTSSDGSVLDIIVTLIVIAIIKFPWLLFILALLGLCKIVLNLIKLFGVLCFHLSKPIIAVSWWLIRMMCSVIICLLSFLVFGILFIIQLPFMYFIWKNIPEMHEPFFIIPEWWYPDW